MTPVYYVSERGHPLLYWRSSDHPLTKPVLTLENYLKWYSLYVIYPDDRVEEVDYALYDGLMSPGTDWYDHVPNPQLLQRLCDKMDWGLDDTAEEVCLARYFTNVRELTVEEAMAL